MPLFSVIIPTYNRAGLIQQTLDSVFAQEFADFEVWVVDDGSTDKTLEVLAGYGQRLKLLRQANQGPGPARNLGAVHAVGQYIVFLDSDDLWFPWTLATYEQMIRKNNQPAIVAGKLIEFTDEQQLTSVHREAAESVSFGDYLQSNRRAYYVGAGMSVLRRDVLSASGGYTDKRINAEDHDLILRLGAAPGFVQVLAPKTVAWRRHAGGATQDWRLTYEGKRYLLDQEAAGRYPGGRARRRERRRILTRYVRPVSLECLRQGETGKAWTLYRATFLWNLQLGRLRYLAAFPVMAVMVSARARRPSVAQP